MNDAVVSYHLNPYTCGVAKFNRQLADRLSVPCLPLDSSAVLPLVSVKPSEIPSSVVPCPVGTYDLFLHDWQDTIRNRTWVAKARTVYTGNAVISQQLTDIRPDVITAWCPSTITGNAHSGPFRVLLFGMGHKVQQARLEQLKRLLTGLDYTVSVSTAVHEGDPWDTRFQQLETELRGVFGDRLRLLGYLADDGLRAELQRSQLVALFFHPGARANNTTLWAAMEAGRAVITNLDAQSPPELVHGRTVLDLERTQTLKAFDLDALGWQGMQAIHGRSWPKLLSVLR